MPENSEKMLRNRKGLAARLLDFFIIANLAFLALDVFLAHSVNAFAHSAEWIPFYFSLGASVLLALILFGKKKAMERVVSVRRWVGCYLYRHLWHVFSSG